MTRYTEKLLLTIGISGLLVGCGGGDSSKSSGKVDEFISLDKKTNVELGELNIEGKIIQLSYSGALMKGEDYLGLIGLFTDDRTEQIAAISSENGVMPSEGGLVVNVPDIPNGYICESFSLEEVSAKKIKNTQAMIISSDACVGQGGNAGKTAHIELYLPESLFGAGTSKLTVKGDKAYLKTEYMVNDKVSVSGGLGTRAYNQIFDLVHNHPEVKTLVEEKISGSIHDEINMQTGRLVRKAGLGTHVTSTSDIASGAVDLFCSGKKRTMEEGAKLGVHSWSGNGVEAGKLPEDSPLHKNQIDYFTEMLGSPTGKEFYFYTINAAPADSIHYMNAAEIAEYQLITE